MPVVLCGADGWPFRHMPVHGVSGYSVVGKRYSFLALTVSITEDGTR